MGIWMKNLKLHGNGNRKNYWKKKYLQKFSTSVNNQKVVIHEMRMGKTLITVAKR